MVGVTSAHSVRNAALGTLAGGAVAGAGLLGYALWEAQSFRLREVSVPLLAAGQDPLRILHLSDMHLTPRQRHKQDWVSSLAALEPDLVIGTGDFLGHKDAVGSVITALGPLLDLPGLFVFGSNDYFAPSIGNPLGYLRGPSDHPRHDRPELPWRDLAAALVACGWTDLSNRRAELKVAGRLIDARGVDDPHIDRDRYELIAGPFDPAADVRLGVAHAPYLRVLDAMAADGADLIVAGHTHGGQVCLPGYGALVTNCDLDRSRAKGLSKHQDAWLHVSAGIGTNPYTPIRVACPPEATLMTLVPKQVAVGL
ncbi:MAG: metallophosphoesterase [Candidatus Nanopelagicales bacterium]|nr:metallophosphoesterase [Candidatus Nanopelagicales bacterium]